MFADSEKLSIRLEFEDKLLLSQYAEDNDMNLSQVIRKAIKEFLKNHSDEE